jgi:putative N6-adenine-specific DNA methylase
VRDLVRHGYGSLTMPAVAAATEILFLPCAAGVEELLAEEVQQIAGGATELYVRRGGVSALVARADATGLAMRLNLESRLAQRVLWCVAEHRYRDEDDIYALTRRVRWADWITPRQTLRVDVTAVRSPLRSLKFAGLRVKDAVCDQLRASAGARPSVDLRSPDLPLVLHLGAEQVALYVDTSGEALFKRGWRGDEGDGPLLDPCCGAGTIAIEAAQLACGIVPGAQRSFAFEQLGPFRDSAGDWQRLRDAAAARVHAPRVPIYASDVSFRMTDFAQRNAERARVRHAIELKTADALQRPAPAPAGTLLLNPPYGERIGAKGTQRMARTPRRHGEASGTPVEFFAQLATHWKQHYCGWTAWILSPDAKLPSVMRLKESRRVPLWNGPIECRLFRFEMVAGSARGRRAAAPPPSPSDRGD